MAKQRSQSAFNSPTQALANAIHALAAADVRDDANRVITTVMPRTLQNHKVGEVDFPAYFPDVVKVSLRMVQAKTGYSLKDCLAETLRHPFRKHNLPASVDLGEGRGHG